MSSEENNPTDNTNSKDDTEKAAKHRTPKSFKPTKIIGFPQKRINITFEGDNGQPSGLIQIKKKKIESLFVKITPKPKKNPDKKVLASWGNWPLVSQVYTYTNNDSYIYIHKGADYVRLDTQEFWMLISQLLKAISDDKHMTEELIAACLDLKLKRYKRPYLDIPLENIKTFNLEEEITKMFQKREEERREKFSEYK